MIQPEDFYVRVGPSYLQQGDIFPDVPLISLPPFKRLVLLRSRASNARLDDLSKEDITLVDEQSVDAFPNGSPEYAVVHAVRSMAVLVTQTCDLMDSEYWLVCPIREIEGSTVDRGNLFSDRYANLIGLPKHFDDYFPEAYITLSDIRPIRSASLQIADRVASLTAEAQELLRDKLARTLSRRWGHEEGEVVPATGSYRCNTCNNYLGPTNPPREFVVGSTFPECEDCKKIRKRAAWYCLLKHKK